MARSGVTGLHAALSSNTRHLRSLQISSFIPAKLSATLLVTSVEKGKKSTEAIDILRILSGGNKPGEKVAECNSVEIDLLVGPCLSFAVSSVGPSSSHMVQVVAKSVVERATIDRVDLVKGASQLGRKENLPIDLEEEEEFCLPFVLDKSVEEQRSVTFTTTLKFDGGKELTSTYAVSLEPKGKGEIGGARGRHVPAMGFEKEGSSGGGGNTIINLNIRNPGNKSIVVGSVFAVEVEVELKSSAVTHINDLILFLVDGVDKVLPIDSSVSVGKMEVGEKRVCKVRFQGLRIGVAKIPEIQVFSKIEKVSYCSPSETDLDGLEVLIVEG